MASNSYFNPTSPTTSVLEYKGGSGASVCGDCSFVCGDCGDFVCGNDYGGCVDDETSLLPSVTVSASLNFLCTAGFDSGSSFGGTINPNIDFAGFDFAPPSAPAVDFTGADTVLFRIPNSRTLNGIHDSVLSAV